MSQEKVERYKKEKANRKTILKKEKQKAFAIKTASVVVAIAVFSWIGYSAYGAIQSNKPETVVSVNMNSVNDYLAGLSTDTSQQ